MSDAVLVAIIGGSFATLAVVGQALVAVASRNHTDRVIGSVDGGGTMMDMLAHSTAKSEEAAQSTAAIQTWCFRHDARDDYRFGELGDKMDKLKAVTDGLAEANGSGQDGQ